MSYRLPEDVIVHVILISNMCSKLLILNDTFSKLIVNHNVKFLCFLLDSLNAYFCIFDSTRPTVKRRVSSEKVTLTPMPTKNSKEDLFSRLTWLRGGWGLGSDCVNASAFAVAHGLGQGSAAVKPLGRLRGQHVPLARRITGVGGILAQPLRLLGHHAGEVRAAVTAGLAPRAGRQPHGRRMTAFRITSRLLFSEVFSLLSVKNLKECRTL